MVYGRTIELFLVNGDPAGLEEAELSNWNGKALKVPRTDVTTCDREDIHLSGVYFLICEEDDGSKSVYIGEAEDVKERLVQHLRDSAAGKENYYWETAVLFVSRDLNKALIRYLENRLVEIATSCRKCHILTKNTYHNTVLKDSQKAAMEEFIDNVKILMHSLGYNILESVSQKPSPEKSSVNPDENAPYLFLERSIKNIGPIKANGQQTADGFVVFKGSQVSPQDDDTISAAIKGRRKSASIDEKGILQENMLFTSPSSAAMFVVGKSADGLISWKTEDGRTLKSLEEE